MKQCECDDLNFSATEKQGSWPKAAGGLRGEGDGARGCRVPRSRVADRFEQGGRENHDQNSQNDEQQTAATLGRGEGTSRGRAEVNMARSAARCEHRSDHSLFLGSSGRALLEQSP